MIRINLLPIRQLKKKQRVRNEVFVFLASLALLLVILALVGFGLANKISGLKTDLAQLQQKKAAYQPILKKIDKLKRDKEILEAKVQAIKTLQMESQVPVRVLDEVANRTPSNRMWLKSLHHAGSSLKLDGIALDNEVIAQYMNDMNDSLYFSNADLIGSSQTVVAKTKLKSFSLNLTVSSPEKGGQHGEGQNQQNGQ